DTFAFLVCVLLSVAAMSLPERIRDPLARGLRQTVLAPFLALQQQTELLSASLERYDAVVAQRDSAALAATFLPELRGENTRLRRPAHLAARAAGRGLPAARAPGHDDPHVGSGGGSAPRHSDRHGGGRRGRSRGMGAYLPHPARRPPRRRHARDDPHRAAGPRRPALAVRVERRDAVRRSDKYRFYVILAALVVLQFSVLGRLGGDRVAPDFLLLALLLYTI